MLRWKLFAVFSVLIELGWLSAVMFGNERWELADSLGTPIDLIGLTGLVTFAFSLPSLPRRFWRMFHPVYLAWIAWELGRAVTEETFEPETWVGVAFALVVLMFNWLALYRLAGSPWNARQRYSSPT